MKKLLLSFCILSMFVYFTNVKAQSGKVLVLDGSSQYMTVNDVSDLNISTGQSLTYTMRIKVPYYSTNTTPRPFSKWSGIGNTTLYELFLGNNAANSGKIAGNLRTTENPTSNVGVTAYLTPSPLLNDDTWHHLAAVLSCVTGSKAIELYLDGIYIGGSNGTFATVPSGSSCVNAAQLIFGASLNSSGVLVNFLGASIDDVRIYNYALSSTDITTDKNTAVVTSSTTGLVAAWDFNNVSGETVSDVTGNGHTGTLVGSPILGVHSNVLNENFKLSVAVSPNPTTDLLNIKVKNANGPVTVKIIALSGKTIHKATISDTEREAGFSLRDKAQGVYIVQVKDANGTINKKVIKQ